MKLKLLVLVLALQSAWVIATVLKQEHALAHGQAILLETEPVDPRDLLSGDYVILNYKISNLPFGLFSPVLTNDLPQGKRVYVLLEQHGEFHEAIRASLAPMKPASGQVMLKGHSVYGWSHDKVRVEYGLERFYVHEGTGNLRGKLTAQIVVPDSSQGQVKQVFVDGKPYAAAAGQQSRTNAP